MSILPPAGIARERSHPRRMTRRLTRSGFMDVAGSMASGAEASRPQELTTAETVGLSMTDDATTSGTEQAAGHQRLLSLLLAMAMFVLVVDTSLMNVSIAAVVEDLDTTVSGVQSAIALEALVSAAFILIGGKVGDLIGRKLAYVLGLLGYAVGALAMASPRA